MAILPGHTAQCTMHSVMSGQFFQVTVRRLCCKFFYPLFVIQHLASAPVCISKQCSRKLAFPTDIFQLAYFYYGNTLLWSNAPINKLKSLSTQQP